MTKTRTLISAFGATAVVVLAAWITEQRHERARGRASQGWQFHYR